MATITTFTIEGLAGRRDVVEHHLNPQVNVFWGINGGGKTSLLRLLDSAMANDGNLIRRVPFKSASVTLREQYGKYTIRRTISAEEIAAMVESEDQDPDLEALASSRERIPWNSTIEFDEDFPEGRRVNEQFPIAHRFLPITRIVRRSRNAAAYWRAVSDAEFQEGTAFANHIRDLWRDYTSRANSQVRGIQQTGLASILAILLGGATEDVVGLATPMEARDAFTLVRTFLADQNLTLRTGEAGFRQRYEKDEVLVGVVENIQQVFERVQEVQKPQQEFQTIMDDLYNGDKHLVATPRSATALRPDISVEWDNKAIPLQGLSSGEKQMLQLLLEVLAAEAVPVMVDEPELSLHVDWQRRLVPSMRRLNPDCQLMLATHSPEVLASVEDHYVFEL